MAALGKKFRSIAGGEIAFWCPGCDQAHTVRIPPTENAWGFNGNLEKPTFTPSISIFQPPVRCHSYIQDGMIQYLTDCSHKLSGMSVELPGFPVFAAAEEESK